MTAAMSAQAFGQKAIGVTLKRHAKELRLRGQRSPAPDRSAAAIGERATPPPQLEEEEDKEAIATSEQPSSLISRLSFWEYRLMPNLHAAASAAVSAAAAATGTTPAAATSAADADGGV